MSRTTNGLINMIDWAHKLIAEVITAGDFAIDLTAGRGHDTLWLAKEVDAAKKGTVMAFDIQQQAIDSTQQRLHDSGFPIIPAPQWHKAACGVSLHHCCHSHLDTLLNPQTSRAPKAAIANFGYLPNGDHGTTTTAPNSCAAILAITTQLQPGGRIALVIYTGHSGAKEEAESIEKLCHQLDGKQWEVLRLQPVNRNSAPYLLMLEKRLTVTADRNSAKNEQTKD